MKKIVLIGSLGLNSFALYNKLLSEKKSVVFFFEEPPSIKEKIRLKFRRFNFLNALGQVVFLITIPKILKIISKNRVKEIEKTYQLDYSEIPNENIIKIKSIDTNLIKDYSLILSSDLIVINGTSIISSEFIQNVSVPILNIHVGITPKYRGVHGGYWSLANKDIENFGVTLHNVNRGIDTGMIIAQKNIKPSKKDNFHTYPLLQYGEGINLLVDFLKNGNGVSLNIEDSNLYTHPTLLKYIKNFISNGTY